MYIVIGYERENNRETPPREVWSPAESQTAERPVWFALEPPWRHGRIPSVTGVRVLTFCENAGGTAEGLPFVPIIRDEGLFYFSKPLIISKG